MEPKHLGYSKRYSELIFFFIHDGYSIDILQPKPLDNQDIARKKDQESYLSQLAQNEMQLRQLIKKKIHERNSRREVIAHELAKELMKCPKDILNHLQHEIAASINSHTLPNNIH